MQVRKFKEGKKFSFVGSYKKNTMSLFECLHVRFDSFSKFFSIFFFQVSGKHLKGVPLLGLAKAKALGPVA